MQQAEPAGQTGKQTVKSQHLPKHPAPQLLYHTARSAYRQAGACGCSLFTQQGARWQRHDIPTQMDVCTLVLQRVLFPSCACSTERPAPARSADVCAAPKHQRQAARALAAGQHACSPAQSAAAAGTGSSAVAVRLDCHVQPLVAANRHAVHGCYCSVCCVLVTIVDEADALAHTSLVGEHLHA